jgi:hypothetical protein
VTAPDNPAPDRTITRAVIALENNRIIVGNDMARFFFYCSLISESDRGIISKEQTMPFAIIKSVLNPQKGSCFP